MYTFSAFNSRQLILFQMQPNAMKGHFVDGKFYRRSDPIPEEKTENVKDQMTDKEKSWHRVAALVQYF